MSNHRIRLAIAAAGSVAAVAAVAPGAAQASYFPPGYSGVCGNAASTHSLGASGLRAAQLGWGNAIVAPSNPLSPAPQQGFGYDAGADYANCAAFKTAADGGTKTLTYKATGSGSCLDIIGAATDANGQPVPNDPRTYFNSTTGLTYNDAPYCGTEDAPTEAQLSLAEQGPPAHPSEAQLITIPVAQISVPVLVRLPDGCQVADNSKRNISRVELNKAFQGVYTTWDQIFGADMTAVSGSGLTSADCRAKTFQRAVRKDKSGTTFVFKRLLHGASNASDGDGFDWREPTYGGTLPNDAWPNDAGATAVVRGAANGNGSANDALAALSANGGIGYSDVPTGRAKSFAWDYNGSYAPADNKLWLRVQRVADDAFVGPAVANAQVTSGSNNGANCQNVVYTGAPTSNLGQSWESATAVPTPVDYPGCGLNYVVTSRWGFDTESSRFRKVWEGTNEGMFRFTRDYLRYVTGIIRPGTGPGQLPVAGYSKLPADIQATAKCAAKLVGWTRASSDGQPGDPIPRDPAGNDPEC